MAKTKKTRKVKGRRVLGEHNSQYKSNYDNDEENTTEDMMSILNDSRGEHNANASSNQETHTSRNTIAGLLGTPSGSHAFNQPSRNNIEQINVDLNNNSTYGMQMPNMPMQNMPMQNMANIDPLHYQTMAVPMNNNMSMPNMPLANMPMPNMPMDQSTNFDAFSNLARQAQMAYQQNNTLNKYDNTMSDLNIDVNELNSTQQSFNNMSLGNNVNNLNNLLTQEQQPSAQQSLANLNNLAKMVGGKNMYRLF